MLFSDGRNLWGVGMNPTGSRRIEMQYDWNNKETLLFSNFVIWWIDKTWKGEKTRWIGGYGAPNEEQEKIKTELNLVSNDWVIGCLWRNMALCAKILAVLKPSLQCDEETKQRIKKIRKTHLDNELHLRELIVSMTEKGRGCGQICVQYLLALMHMCISQDLTKT